MSYSWQYWDDSGPHSWGVGVDLPNGTDLFNADFVNQFIVEHNRRTSLGVGQLGSGIVTFGPFIGGCDVAFTFDPVQYPASKDNPFIQELQASIRGIANNGAYAGSASRLLKTQNPTSLSGLASFDWMYATVLGVEYPSNFNASGMPRATTVHPSDAGFSGFEYRIFRQGDILGPWIFEDMRIILDRCTVISIPMGTALVTALGRNKGAPLATWPSTWSVGSISGMIADWTGGVAPGIGRQSEVTAEFVLPSGYAGLSVPWYYFFKAVTMLGGMAWSAQGMSFSEGIYHLLRQGTVAPNTAVQFWPIDDLWVTPTDWGVPSGLGWVGESQEVVIDIG